MRPALGNDAAYVRRRRWLMPVVVLCIAGGVAWWASARETSRMNDVRSGVRDLCQDIAAGQDVTGRVNPTSKSIEKRIIEAIRKAVPDADTAEVIEIMVTPGDAGRMDTLGAEASHTVALKLEDIDLLTLRVQHRDGPPRVGIIGYSLPDAVRP